MILCICFKKECVKMDNNLKRTIILDNYENPFNKGLTNDDSFYKVNANNIQILNVPFGLWATLEQQYTIYDLLVSGLEADLNTIEEPSIKGSLDVGAWMEEEGINELVPGVYYIPAQISLPENVNQKPIEIRVTITDSSELE